MKARTFIKVIKQILNTVTRPRDGVVTISFGLLTESEEGLDNCNFPLRIRETSTITGLSLGTLKITYCEFGDVLRTYTQVLTPQSTLASFVIPVADIRAKNTYEFSLTVDNILQPVAQGIIYVEHLSTQALVEAPPTDLVISGGGAGDLG